MNNGNDWAFFRVSEVMVVGRLGEGLLERLQAVARFTGQGVGCFVEMAVKDALVEHEVSMLEVTRGGGNGDGQGT